MSCRRCSHEEFRFDSQSWLISRERYESFWRGEMVDRPLLCVTSPKQNTSGQAGGDLRPRDPDELFRWYTDPDRVIPRLEQEIENTHYAGDAFPCVFPVSCSLVAIQAAYLGARYYVNHDSGSGWSEPIITEWATRRTLAVDEDNSWWRITRQLLTAGVEALGKRAVIGIPDIEGGGQILAQLRGTEELAIDLIDHSEEIHRAMREIDLTWRQYWEECSRISVCGQPAYVDWLRIWSDHPAVTVECDFSIMISPEMFNEFFVPSIEQQTKWVGRTIYHLDGEGAIRHLDALLAMDTLDGIQWVPGSGARPMSEWVSLLKRIQDAGKLLVLSCNPAEVDVLLSALRPEGVLLSTRCRTVDEADALVNQVVRRFK